MGHSHRHLLWCLLSASSEEIPVCMINLIRTMDPSICRTTSVFSFFSSFSFFILFRAMHLRHVEVPRLGVGSELQQPVSTATAMPDLSHFCNLHHSSWQHRIVYPYERGQGSNPHPHEQQLGSLPLSHNRNSPLYFLEVKNETGFAEINR